MAFDTLRDTSYLEVMTRGVLLFKKAQGVAEHMMAFRE
jgi:hypothetical protein